MLPLFASNWKSVSSIIIYFIEIIVSIFFAKNFIACLLISSITLLLLVILNEYGNKIFRINEK